MLLACTMVPTWYGSARAEQPAGEYQVEAAYLYNFVKTTRWSTEKLPDGADLIIGVLGGDEDFVKVLHDVLVNKDINGHTLEVRRLSAAEEVRFCHVIFFRTSERITRAAIAQFRKSNVLLVGENKEFLNDGGMINLEWDDGKITYEVNTAALERANLRYGQPNATIAKPNEQIPEVQPESSRSITFRVVPEYPRLAASLKLAGAVQLKALVRADGTVRKVRVVGGHPVLAEAAMTAVMKWHFEPAARETTESVKVSFGE